MAPDLAVEPELGAQPSDHQGSDYENGVEAKEDEEQDDNGFSRADDEARPERVSDIMEVSTFDTEAE